MAIEQDWRDPTRLMALLTEQRNLYRDLRALSERQRSLISGDQPELLLNILRDRQGLVTALTRLNEELAPFRRNWEAIHAQLSASAREQTSELLAEINGLLRAILKTDQEDSALLSARKQTVAAEIAELSGGRIANSAYARQGGARQSQPSADLTG